MVAKDSTARPAERVALAGALFGQAALSGACAIED